MAPVRAEKKRFRRRRGSAFVCNTDVNTAEIADRVANRVTGAPRTARPAPRHVELGPRVFAYKSGYNHNVSVVARTDFAVKVPQRRGATVRASLWVPQRAGETEGVREHLSVVLYCGSNQRSGRLDCVASHALTVCLELGVACCAMDCSKA